MSDDFDGYQQWLGIEPDGGPLDHYRLLGLNRFESDTEAIVSAVDQRMARVRQHQTGPRGRYTQEILNRLATARICLLNPAAKASYDQALAATMARAEDILPDSHSAFSGPTSPATPPPLPPGAAGYQTDAPPLPEPWPNGSAPIAPYDPEHGGLPPAHFPSHPHFPSPPYATSPYPASTDPLPTGVPLNSPATPYSAPPYPVSPALGPAYPQSPRATFDAPALDDTDDQPFYNRPVFPIAAGLICIFIAIAFWTLRRFPAPRADGPPQVAVEVNEADESPGDTVLQPEAEPQHNPPPPLTIIQQEGDGGFNFVPSLVRLHGPTVKLMRLDDADCIGDWRSEDDWLEWSFRVVRPGVFRVHISYTLPSESAGGSYWLELDGKAVRKVETRETIEPGEWVTDEYFIPVPSAGEHRFSVRPAAFDAAQLMILRSIRFTPSGR